LEILLLLLLLVSAGVIFLPGILKERVLGSPIDTISDFRRGMIALAISTHNYKPAQRSYYASASGGSDPEPYVRRSYYSDQDNAHYDDDFMPYPSNKAKGEMETRRNRIIALLLVVTLSTGICAIVPKLRWIIPLHIMMLLVLTIYIGLVILLPHYERRR
jgi:hypothetical protein